MRGGQSCAYLRATVAGYTHGSRGRSPSSLGRSLRMHRRVGGRASPRAVIKNGPHEAGGHQTTNATARAVDAASVGGLGALGDCTGRGSPIRPKVVHALGERIKELKLSLRHRPVSRAVPFVPARCAGRRRPCPAAGVAVPRDRLRLHRLRRGAVRERSLFHSLPGASPRGSWPRAKSPAR